VDGRCLLAARLLSRIVGGCKFVVLLWLVRENDDYALASVDEVEGLHRLTTAKQRGGHQALIET
jgi:hypothetical protein